ncbi:hypothetical protein ACJX0J_007173, partial [Zea mays]
NNMYMEIEVVIKLYKLHLIILVSSNYHMFLNSLFVYHTLVGMGGLGGRPLVLKAEPNWNVMEFVNGVSSMEILQLKKLEKYQEGSLGNKKISYYLFLYNWIHLIYFQIYKF